MHIQINQLLKVIFFLVLFVLLFFANGCATEDINMGSLAITATDSGTEAPNEDSGTEHGSATDTDSSTEFIDTASDSDNDDSDNDDSESDDEDDDSESDNDTEDDLTEI